MSQFPFSPYWLIKLRASFHVGGWTQGTHLHDLLKGGRMAVIVGVDIAKNIFDYQIIKDEQEDKEYYFEYREDENASIYRLGFTVDEVEGILKWNG